MQRSWEFYFKQDKEDMINGADDCIAVWCQEEHVKSAVLQQLKNKVKQLIYGLWVTTL